MKKILSVVCILIILFILGMMIRRYYDSHYKSPEGTLHRVVAPAAEVPAEFKKAGPTPTPPAAPSGQSSSLRPPEKKDN